MGNKIIDEVNSLVPKLRDKELEEDVQGIKSLDPISSLKICLFDFFRNRLNKIKKEDELFELTKKALMDKIKDGGPEITFSQLENLLLQLKKDSRSETNDILDLFKSSEEGSGSSLITIIAGGSNKGKDDSDLGDLKPDEYNNLHKLTRLLEKLDEKEDKK